MDSKMSIDSGYGRESDTMSDYMATPSMSGDARQINSLPSSTSSKRSLFREERTSLRHRKNGDSLNSDIDSDLGHMSPLALTDPSSCDSSPGRQFISPLATPDKTPTRSDRLKSKCNKSSSLSPFCELRRLTRAARSSPRKILFLDSQSQESRYSSQITNTQNTYAEDYLTSPDSHDETLMPEEVIPETPVKGQDYDDQSSFIDETPQKDDVDSRLNTPLGSVTKNAIPIPRLHRRKSLSSLDDNSVTSPEIKKYQLKRQLEESPEHSTSKYQKTHEFSSIPKARAALFQEETDCQESIPDSKIKNFVVKTSSFYGAHKDNRKSLDANWKFPDKSFGMKIGPKKPSPRHSSQHSSNRRSKGKKSRTGEINSGVRHGLKRPKPKRPIPSDPIKTEKQKVESGSKKETFDSKMQAVISEKIKEHTRSVSSSNKFFKTESTKPTNAISQEKDLNQAVVESACKRARMEIPLDVTDLTVDEPNIEATIKQNEVNILKVIHDDWSDDESDYIPTTSNTRRIPLSPDKSNVLLKNVTMSPASVLSNLASTMNLTDTPCSKNLLDGNCDSENKPPEKSSKHYYPLFSKGFSPNIPNEEKNIRKRKRSNGWQLSAKHGKSDDQYQIDAGQKLFGVTQCKECGIFYHVGDPDDENAHLNYHNSTKILKFTGWKNERVIMKDPFSFSRIIVIDPKDPTLHWKKVTEILEVVDRDLGLCDVKLSFYRDKKVYLYVRDKVILGVLVAEPINSAFRMIPELLELNCCTSESVPAKCGINVVWTAMSHRRQGIATKLVDTLRANYFYGYIMTTDDLTFSTPTPSGKAFAEKYTKTKNFKVYN